MREEFAVRKLQEENDSQRFHANVGGAARVMASSQKQKRAYEPVQVGEDGDETFGSLPTWGRGETTALWAKLGVSASYAARNVIPVSFAVFINVLDACTFGSIFFPSRFGTDVAGIAIEMFLLSTVVVQVVLIQCSSFSSGLGTAQAENIPFVHTMATGVYNSMAATHSPREMLPTVMVTVCVSTILNGVLFFVVGYFKLGNILHFFPRHVIMGMTAGFGIFLLNCGVESSTGVVMADQTLASLVAALSPSPQRYQLLIVFVFEGLLRVVEHLKVGELVVPCLMFLMPIAFYVALTLTHTDVGDARSAGWLFPETASVKWWESWSLFDFALVEWSVVLEQWMTISSLAVFTLILVPIRIPSLAIITGDEVNFDEEFKAQGLANILSGLMGAVHNYLSYSNSIFYFFVGGKGKASQGAVAAITMLIFFVGPRIISYVPRCIAGVIMLHLGVDLVLGSLVTSRSILDNLEYASVVIIAAVVSFLGFVPGVIAGVASTCATYVIQSSRQSSIRSVFSGEMARSNTSWSSHQRDRLYKGLADGSSIFVIQLQGHLFFGNVQHVVEGIENTLKLDLSKTKNNGNSGGGGGGGGGELAAHTPQRAALSRLEVRYLILDCSFITGADVNAVAGLLKLKSKMSSEQFDVLDERPADRSQPRPPASRVRVHVLFAGLQESLEAMFALQEASMRERQQHLPRATTAVSSSSSPSPSPSPSSSPSGTGSGADFGALGGAERQGPNRIDVEDGVGLGLTPSRSSTSEVDAGWSQSRPLAHHRSRAAKDSGGGGGGGGDDSYGSFSNLPEAPFTAGQCPTTPTTASAVAKAGAAAAAASASAPLGQEYFSDANTALQAVEERIIKTTHLPIEGARRSFTKRRSFSFHVSDGETLSSELRREHMLSSTDNEPSHSAQVQQLLLIQSQMQMQVQSQMQMHEPTPQRPAAVAFHPDIAAALAGGGISSGGASVSPALPPASWAGVQLQLPAHVRAQLMTHPQQQRPTPPPGRDAAATPFSDTSSNASADTPSAASAQRPLSASSTASSSAIAHYPVATPPPPPPFDNLSPATKALKHQIANMLFDLSPQWTVADSPALKRLARRLMMGVRAVKRGHVLWEADSEATQMGIVLSGRLKAVLRPADGKQAAATAGRGSGVHGSGSSSGISSSNGSISSGRADAAQTLQVILPGNVFGELGLLSRGVHSRTIVASTDSRLAMLDRNSLDEIEECDKALLVCLQHLALRTAAVRSHELMLFNAGSLGP